MDIEKKYEELISYVDTYISQERGVLLKKMYEDLGDRLLLSPASSYNFYHNAFPGGYIDHILRVTKNALELYNYFDILTLEQKYTKENIVMAALNHDLGKLGMPGEDNELYKLSNDAWAIQNRGKMYDINMNIPYSLVADRSIYLLQYYGISLDWEEFLAIRIHDGLFDEANKSYYISVYDAPKLKTNLPYLIHMADFLAARKEYELWKTPVEKPKEPSTKIETKDLDAALDSILGITK